MHDPMAILSSPIDLDAVAFLLDVDGTLIDLAPTPDAVSATGVAQDHARRARPAHRRQLRARQRPPGRGS
jgi:trehalose-6-phosphatase